MVPWWGSYYCTILHNVTCQGFLSSHFTLFRVALLPIEIGYYIWVSVVGRMAFALYKLSHKTTVPRRQSVHSEPAWGSFPTGDLRTSAIQHYRHKTLPGCEMGVNN